MPKCVLITEKLQAFIQRDGGGGGPPVKPIICQLGGVGETSNMGVGWGEGCLWNLC